MFITGIQKSGFLMNSLETLNLVGLSHMSTLRNALASLDIEIEGKRPRCSSNRRQSGYKSYVFRFPLTIGQAFSAWTSKNAI